MSETAINSFLRLKESPFEMNKTRENVSRK